MVDAKEANSDMNKEVDTGGDVLETLSVLPSLTDHVSVLLSSSPRPLASEGRY